MPPLPDFDSSKLLGALEIGAFLSIFMFGAVTMQGHVYYQNCKDDSKWFIFFITSILLLELGHAIATARSVWWATITIADMVIKPGNGYSIAACTLCSTVTTFLVKAYYIDRVRRLSSKWWLAIIGWLLTVISFGASLMVTYETYRDVPREPNNFELQREWGWLITLNLGLDALADVFIAAALVYQLRQLAMPVHASPMKKYRNSAKMLNELLLWTIETGLLSSVASIAALVCFHLMEFNYIWFAVYLPLATLYSNSLLASLNARTVRRRRLGLVQQQQSAPSSGNSYRSQVSLRSVKVSSSWASGTSGTRRSTIGSSCARVNPSVPASPNPRRSTVGSGSSVANSNKENITADNDNPRHRINSLLLDINGKRRMRESHVYTSTRPRTLLY
ncbi:hypothetical protein C8J55DRAFT_566103 [Lentinula edodes]|uniref:DUF6534 domain-containing protein n=1 Tax=Lentinula lateritia TaxID=40482 RepID=A0A9W8ZTW5_9AGAR|nr:hypothetical protein C8J55DRAFT_566103 [Lentinula edodes]